MTEPFAASNRFSWVRWLAAGCGLGWAPFAPGTFGAMGGLLLTLGIAQIPWIALQYLVLAAVLALGVPLCTTAGKIIGRKDPGEVVWDEIAAVPCVFLLLPAWGTGSWAVLVTGWALFRIFDITKPPPVRLVERLPAGWGIMADDLVAAGYAGAILHLLLAMRVVA